MEWLQNIDRLGSSHPPEYFSLPIIIKNCVGENMQYLDACNVVKLA